MNDLHRVSTDPARRLWPLDVVLAPSPASGPQRSRSMLIGIAIASAAHAGLVALALHSGPSLETWSARLALSVHAALLEARPVDVEAPPPEAPPQAPAPEPQVVRAPAAPKLPRALRANPPPSAAAAPAVAIAAGPVDLTATAIVTGSALVSNGGYSSTRGTGTGQGAGDVPGHADARPGSQPALSRGVTLDPADWHCAWPKEALALDIFEQSVVLRVVVRADGSAESVRLVSEPGFGLGRAALACARNTRFQSARDAAGRAVRATSPPIRVRFTR